MTDRQLVIIHFQGVLGSLMITRSPITRNLEDLTTSLYLRLDTLEGLLSLSQKF